ncbi:MAG: hypothetical protein K2O71_04870, partial [Lachnospiraceae bacterium]|nr:hypothetical protein [Lachnospiraceae bacterium]
MKYFFIIAGIFASFVLFFFLFLLFRRIFFVVIDRRIERFQSDLIERQVEEIQDMYRQVRGWRHDYRN